MTWLSVLNFVVLQWFGVRLARVVERKLFGPWLLYATNAERARWVRGETVRWKLLRWIVPLTGWWSDFRYIARRS